MVVAARDAQRRGTAERAVERSERPVEACSGLEHRDRQRHAGRNGEHRERGAQRLPSHLTEMEPPPRSAHAYPQHLTTYPSMYIQIYPCGARGTSADNRAEVRVAGAARRRAALRLRAEGCLRAIPRRHVAAQ